MNKKLIKNTIIAFTIITPTFCFGQIKDILNTVNNLSKNIGNNKDLTKEIPNKSTHQFDELVVFGDPIEVYFSDNMDYKKNFLRDSDNISREQWIKNPGISYNAPKSISDTELSKFTAAINQVFFNKLNSSELSKSYNICKNNVDKHLGNFIDILTQSAKASMTAEKRDEYLKNTKEIVERRTELAPSMCAIRFIRQILFAMNIPGYSSSQNRSSGDEIAFEGIWTGQEYRAANAVITKQLTDKFYKNISQELVAPEPEWINNYATFVFDSSGNRVYQIKQPLANRVYSGYMRSAFNLASPIKKNEIKP